MNNCLKEMRGLALWLSRGRALRAEGTASAKPCNITDVFEDTKESRVVGTR